MLFEFIEKPDNKKDTILYDESTGLEKGNMFKNLYSPYKNYEPKELIPKTEREALLYNILKLSFALNDLNLYLDIHHDDERVYQVFMECANALKRCVEEYEKKYQVLELCHDTFGKYTWISNPWPWEDYYV